MQNATLTDAVRHYQNLTGKIMPELARSEKIEWPVRNDHCFQRIVLDTICGGVWYEHIARPAYKHLSDAQALRAVQLCEDIIAGRANLSDLNRKSLLWRGKLRAGCERKGYRMTRQAQIELRDLHIPASIGTYGPDDVVPDAHVLDLDLTIPADLVQIASDAMAHVFDYDHLIAQIALIARTRKFETQEYLMTLIAQACAAHTEILGVEICLRKYPVLADTGSLGVRLIVGSDDLAVMRRSKD